MGYVDVVTSVMQSELDRLAVQIEAELKSAVASRVGKKSSRSTGAAVASIHIEVDSPTQRFIGANINWSNHNDGGLHLYYFDQGNGHGFIRPKRSKALHLEHIGSDVYAKTVRTYSGAGVVKEVANRHR